jgi:hypothetical protein
MAPSPILVVATPSSGAAQEEGRVTDERVLRVLVGLLGGL